MNEPPQNKVPDVGDRVWEHGWQDHSRRQLERLARLPLSEKLVWLEEAHRLVLHMTGERRRLSTNPPPEVADR
jgi:hypothetical protein